MNSKYNVIIRCDIGQHAGFGHYTRCSLLKKSFERLGVDVSFIVKPLGSFPGSISICHDKTITGNFLDEVEQYQGNNMIFILDILNKENINNKDLGTYIKTLSSKSGSRIFLIEGLGWDSCPRNLYTHIDGLFTPYLQFQGANRKNHMGGLDYVIIDSDKIIKEKKIKPKANHTLITFGGSDVWKQNQQILSYLSNESIECSYKIVVGPLVGAHDARLLELYSQYLDLEIINNPTNMKDLFTWADLVITNTGQTRYELAACGIPFIIIPFDENGYKNSLVFENLGIARLLSPNCTREDFNSQFTELLQNQNTRYQMSKKGKRFCFNLKGADNIASKVYEVVN
jgi:spore coat polysaccharide biosynthesis predicted glycosyltransferase SpsG